jgi:hypothetical protein
MNGKREYILIGLTLAILQPGTYAWATDLVDLIPGLYGGDGITLAPPAGNFPSHETHFNVSAGSVIYQLNKEIAGEVRPIQVNPSPGGITYEFDPERGTYMRTTHSLGPIVADRPQTLGKGKFSLGFAFTYFKYDKFEGDNLNNIKATAVHIDTPSDGQLPSPGEPSFELDTIQIDLDVDLEFQTFAVGGTYGITDRLDVGVVIPIVRADMDVKSNARIVVSPQNTFPGIHRFDPNGEQPFDSANDSATGIGDVFLGTKYYWLDREKFDMAGALTVKLNTGDEDNFLGTGDTTIRPFLVASGKITDWVTPHFNLGYEFNVDDSNKNNVNYAAGFEIGNEKLTGIFDLLGRHETDGDGIGENIVDAAFGAKWSPHKNIILAANFLIPVNKDEGLRSDLISTVGIEYRN